MNSDAEYIVGELKKWIKSEKSAAEYEGMFSGTAKICVVEELDRFLDKTISDVEGEGRGKVTDLSYNESLILATVEELEESTVTLIIRDLEEGIKLITPKYERTVLSQDTIYNLRRELDNLTIQIGDKHGIYINPENDRLVYLKVSPVSGTVYVDVDKDLVKLVVTHPNAPKSN